MSEPESKAVELELPIEWYVPDATVTKYATNMVIQHTEHEFILSFFEVAPPLLIGTPSKEVLEGLKSIRAECVARIVIARDRMPGFVEILRTNLEQSLSKRPAKVTE
jgi:hypothetical protein